MRSRQPFQSANGDDTIALPCRPEADVWRFQSAQVQHVRTARRSLSAGCVEMMSEERLYAGIIKAAINNAPRTRPDESKNQGMRSVRRGRKLRYKKCPDKKRMSGQLHCPRHALIVRTNDP